MVNQHGNTTRFLVVLRRGQGSGVFGMATRVVSMSTLVFLFPLLKKRYGDGVCLMLAVFGRGAGGFAGRRFKLRGVP